MDVRIKFNKNKEVKYISHLDLLRTFNRMLMRSSLKLAYSQGYNPHILLSFAQPSSVGMETKNDCADISLMGEYSLDEIKEKLIKSAPAGIEITDVTTNRTPAFNKIAKASYKVFLECNKGKEEISEFLSREEIFIDKKTKKGIKEVDIKPQIFEYELNDEEGILVNFCLASGSNSNLNPSLIIKAMEKYIDGFSCEYYKITREYLVSEDGEIY